MAHFVANGAKRSTRRAGRQMQPSAYGPPAPPAALTHRSPTPLPFQTAPTRRQRDMKNPSVPWVWGRKVRQWAGSAFTSTSSAASTACFPLTSSSPSPLRLRCSECGSSCSSSPDGKNGHGSHPSRAYSSDDSHALATSSFSSFSTEHVAYTTRRDTEAARLSSES